LINLLMINKFPFNLTAIIEQIKVRKLGLRLINS
jgi:hypothetical protein